MATIRVAVMAESAVVRAGLRALLAAEPGIVVVGAFGAADVSADDGGSRVAALVRVTDVDAGVVVWAPSTDDLASLPDGDEASDEANDEAARMPALVLLVDHVDAELARRALAARVHALLPLDAGEAAVIAAVHAAAAGLVTLPRELVPLLTDATAVEMASGGASLRGVSPRADVTNGNGGTASPLTAREREVLTLLAQGLANKQIAPRLGITEHTVKAHVAAIYDKLGAGNRAEAAIAAARLGLLLL